jgi:hypothetical protein
MRGARPFKGLCRIARICVSRLYNQCPNHNRDALLFSRYHMEMRRQVIVKVHFNTAAIEVDDGWHNE